MEERKFRSLGRPGSFKEYAELVYSRFEFSSFDSQIERLAQAWKGEGNFSEKILGYMSAAPFIGNLTTRDFSVKPEVVLYLQEDVVKDPILREIIGEKALQSLAGMLHTDYRGGLRIATKFKKGHPEPEFVVPGLGITDRKLVLHLDRCGSAEAYSFLFEKQG